MPHEGLELDLAAPPLALALGAVAAAARRVGDLVHALPVLVRRDVQVLHARRQRLQLGRENKRVLNAVKKTSIRSICAKAARQAGQFSGWGRWLCGKTDDDNADVPGNPAAPAFGMRGLTFFLCARALHIYAI